MSKAGRESSYCTKNCKASLKKKKTREYKTKRRGRKDKHATDNRRLENSTKVVWAIEMKAVMMRQIPPPEVLPGVRTITCTQTVVSTRGTLYLQSLNCLYIQHCKYNSGWNNIYLSSNFYVFS